eukprot:GDKJ01029029.1.p1 GENE.GDKJ01029029.1~~GDKJ01029029.1.p1  ORF type:complete len:238 (-),score=56.14 GDKJ01029029.1:36-728(-)
MDYKKSVFIGNLNYRASEEDIKGFLEKAGPVLSVRIAVDRQANNQSKGFAVVEFVDTEGAKNACAMSGATFFDRMVRIGMAIEKQKDNNIRPRRNERMPDNKPAEPDEDVQEEQKEVEENQATDDTDAVTAAVNAAATSEETQARYERNDFSAAAAVTADLDANGRDELIKSLQWMCRVRPEETRMLLLQNPALAYTVLHSLLNEHAQEYGRQMPLTMQDFQNLAAKNTR